VRSTAENAESADCLGRLPDYQIRRQAITEKKLRSAGTLHPHLCRDLVLYLLEWPTTQRPNFTGIHPLYCFWGISNGASLFHTVRNDVLSLDLKSTFMECDHSFNNLCIYQLTSEQREVQFNREPSSAPWNLKKMDIQGTKSLF